MDEWRWTKAAGGRWWTRPSGGSRRLTEHESRESDRAGGLRRLHAGRRRPGRRVAGREGFIPGGFDFIHGLAAQTLGEVTQVHQIAMAEQRARGQGAAERPPSARRPRTGDASRPAPASRRRPPRTTSPILRATTNAADWDDPRHSARAAAPGSTIDLSWCPRTRKQQFQ